MERQSEDFKLESERMSHRDDLSGIWPIQNKLVAIQKLKQAKNEKDWSNYPEIL